MSNATHPDIEKGSPELEESRNHSSISNRSKDGDTNEEYSSLLSYIDKQEQGDEVLAETEEEEKLRKRIWWVVPIHVEYTT